MRRVHSFILTSSVIYGCKYCGQWQKISRWKWVALMACKRHERTCVERADDGRGGDG